MLDAKPITKREINLYGVTGEFKVQNDNDNSINVRYFQTVATKRKDDESGNSFDLLTELKPMRERVKATDLKDLRSLLQRDLNDFRVANELVPYLQGQTSPVGFFPAILVALMPKDFLTEKKASYPKFSSIEPPEGIGRKLKYGEHWSTENFKIASNTVAFAKLSVDPSNTDFIVLDGQHRANAFRYLTGTFDEATNDSSIYSAFYQNCSKSTTEFDAELPVTIVWFESLKDIEPSIISRKLFVDVNTTSKKVSESRNILLDDLSLASISVTTLYSQLAANGYGTDEFSLLHSGFDCDGSFPSDFPKTTIISPKNLKYAFDYLLLSPSAYRSIKHVIAKESSNSFNNFTSSRVKDLCPEILDSMITDIENGSHDAVSQISNAYSESLIPNIIKIFNEFIFFTSHFQSCQLIDKSVLKDSVEKSSAWNKLYKGGEGLYSAILEADKKLDGKLEGRLQTYHTAIADIDGELINTRQELSKSDKNKSAFTTMISQAGVTGLLMSLDSCYEKSGWNDKLITDFIKSLNFYSEESWNIILSEYKSGVVKELTPKQWTTMRRIILRFISEAKYFSFKDKDYGAHHPDIMFCSNLIKTKKRRWEEDNQHDEETPIPIESYQEWIENSILKLEELLQKINGISIDRESIKITLSEIFGC